MSEPPLLSLEDSAVKDFSAGFQGQKVVYFSRGGSCGHAKMKAVDYLGAVKVLDAIEAVEGTKPRLVWNLDATDFPAHYVRGSPPS